MNCVTKCDIKTKLMAIKQFLIVVTWRFPPWKTVSGVEVSAHNLLALLLDLFWKGSPKSFCQDSSLTVAELLVPLD